MKKLYTLVGALLPLCANGQCPVDLELTTQAQVSAFQATYTDCTSLPGNLTITGDDITDLSNLVTLTNVGGNLLVNGQSAVAKSYRTGQYTCRGRRSGSHRK
ncbi:hypothetical protein MUK70_09045 [Dyadobacter chenwenxiniae]|uniref:hypothetical protein n=1 Tax=Dyadobacter chenwenxiniae TaxID=2906456 RepID=UPI001FD56334|nr:hypothetical protein [Dyadobacter chenwenxiniae]UON85127.1 hypothetical protein MUK70_09045 [Dyadobacter chenwenxiniae]